MFNEVDLKVVDSGGFSIFWYNLGLELNIKWFKTLKNIIKIYVNLRGLRI